MMTSGALTVPLNWTPLIVAVSAFAAFGQDALYSTGTVTCERPPSPANVSSLLNGSPPAGHSPFFYYHAGAALKFEAVARELAQ
jgi:hypothetical protein